MRGKHNRKYNFDYLLIASLALAFPVIVLTPIFRGQLPGTNDAALHLHRLISAVLNLRNGIIWPRWSPALHFGFGYPIGNFYDPGWHVAGAFLVIAGIPAVTVELIAQAIGIVLYPIGGYLFGRLIGGRIGGLLGAAIFLYAPFRFYELFEQGNISQLTAMALIPWALWAIGRCALQPSLRQVAIGGLITAVLMVMHHPTAFAFLPFAGLYAVLIGFAPFADSAIKRRSRIFAPIAAFAIGVMIGAIYWLPALTELKDVRVSQAATGLYDVQSNFVPFTELIGSNRALDRAALNAPRPFNVGQPGLIVAVIGLIAALWPRSKLNRWQRSHLIGAASVIIGCLYLMTDRSAWLWALFPPAQAIQFPWRLMGIVTAATIPGAAILTTLLPTRWRGAGALIGVLIVIIVALPAMPPIQPNVSEPANLTPGDSIRYEATTGNLGAVATYEYTPRWSSERPLFDPCAACYDNWNWFIRVDQASIPAGVHVSTIPATQRSGTRFQIDTPAAFTLTLHQFYFSGWQIAIDGATVPIEISTPYGLMTTPISAGSHTVEAWYAGTPEQHIGDLMAVIGVGLCVVLLIVGGLRSPHPNPSPKGEGLPNFANVRHSNWSFAGLWESGMGSEGLYRRLGIGLTALLIAFTPIAYPITETFRANGSPTQPIGAALAIHKVFVDSSGTPLIELVGADLPANVSPRQNITARLYWHAIRPLQAGWRVALKIQNTSHTVDWANSDNSVPGGFSTDVWPIDRYVVDTHQFTVSPDAPPYVGDFMVSIYNDAGSVLHTDSPIVAPIRVEVVNCRPSPNNVNVRFGDALTLTGYTVAHNTNHATLDLYWRVDSTPNPSDDLALFVHVMTRQTLVANADSPPLADYPSHLWQSSQCLHRQITLDLPANTDRLLIGFYRRSNGLRLPAIGSAAIQDNGLVIPIGK